jgi:protein-S-isoprenylcysteine O-methyltransferase Ste14
MNISLQPWTWTALWPYAVVIGVLMSWALYHFLAPANWRDRAGAGVVQAFIIALYAEMYGFPLTVYFLAGVLPLKVPLLHSSGHLWSTLLRFGPLGAAIETILGYALLLAGALLVVKGWVKIYFAGGKLVDDGVYGLIRHPQYAGIFLIVLGEIVDWPTIPSLAFAPIIVWIYVRLARREESRLDGKFGAEYRDYRSRVPMLVPRREDLVLFLLGA